MTTKLNKNVIEDNYLYPESIKYEKNFREVKGNIKIEYDDNNIENLEKFGRLFILEEFMPEESIQMIFVWSEKIQYLNQALLNDLEDFIIVQGLKYNNKDYFKDKTKATE